MNAFLVPLRLPVNLQHLHPTNRNYRNLIICQTDPSISRRAFLTYASALLAASPILPSNAFSIFSNKPQPPISPTTSTVFSVIPTSVANVNLLPVSIEEAITDASTSAALFLGEHHNSLVDHVLQARIIQSLNSTRPVQVALEMVQQRFQPALDRYIAREISELDLYLAIEWDTRWVWPYENYLPVLRLCRRLSIPLIALSIDSETLIKLRAPSGIANLSSDDVRSHVGNPSVFAEISNTPAFKAYISECITPSYAAHYRMGLLRHSDAANFTAFYTARVLHDEAMATRAVRAIRDRPDATVVCLLGSDHVKFEYGVRARVQRQLDALAARDAAKGSHSQPEPLKEPRARLTSVMLNPGPADAYDARDKSLKLEMVVDGDPIPIADYLWFSGPDARPRRQVKSRLLPPVERLTSF